MIYFITDGEYTKIGYTEKDDVQQRLAALQIGNARPLTIVGTIEGGREVETLLHWRFVITFPLGGGCEVEARFGPDDTSPWWYYGQGPDVFPLLRKAIQFAEQHHAEALGDRHAYLVDKKFATGLTPAETAELKAVNAALDDVEAAWYAPVIEMLRAAEEKARQKAADPQGPRYPC